MASQKKTVLVADDDSILRMVLATILTDSDIYEVIGESSNGADVIKKFSLLSPDLVLLDINMPQIDGLQALEKIREINPAAKVLMISSTVTMEKVKEAITKGAKGFVVKPISAEIVLKKVGDCFK